jgi:acyl carrier protein
MERARELLQTSSAAGSQGAAHRNSASADHLLEIASSCFKAERSALSLSSVPRDVPGWDSLAHLEFVCALEKQFGLQLSARDIMSLDRLDKALELVTRT